jgi:hypothetical protein
MEQFVKFVFLCVAGFLIMFPLGQLYIRGKAGPRIAAASGALIGVLTGLIWGWPSYEPRGAIIGAMIALALISSIVLALLLALLPRMGFPPPHKGQ